MELNLDQIAHIEGVVNYLEYTGERPSIYMYAPPPEASVRSAPSIKHRVPVYDGRQVANDLTLDGAGFAFLHHETKVVDFYDTAEVERVYYPEVAQLVKEYTGAIRVHVFDHNVRCRTKARAGVPGVREPVKFVHNDYTLKSGPQRVRDLMGQGTQERSERGARDERSGLESATRGQIADADELLKHHFMQINVWRPIREPVEETPLGVCDARSMVPDDFVPMDLVYEDRLGEIYTVKFNPHHRWFYFPRMRRNEVLLLKGYDSANDGRARFTGHTGFEDTTSPADATPRESIEARMLVFFSE